MAQAVAWVSMGCWDLSVWPSTRTGGGTEELLPPGSEPWNCWDPNVEFRLRPHLWLKASQAWSCDITLQGNFEPWQITPGNP